MDPVLVVLRLVHIIAGILWVGGAVFVFRFVEPTAAELGPQAEGFMNGMVNKRKMTTYFPVAAALTVLAGTALFWIDAGGDVLGWITRSGTGLTFAIGGVAAWAAFIIGMVWITPAIDRVGALGQELKAAAASGPPPAELVARMDAAQARVKLLGQVDLVLLGIAVVAMAIARYVG